MFANTYEDMLYLLNETGYDIRINKTDNIKAFIKSLKQSDFDDKEIRTNHPIKRGDIIIYQGIQYLVITESVTKKPLLYKAQMRNYNSILETEYLDPDRKPIGYDDFMNPIYDDKPALVTLPIIIENQTVSVDGNKAIRVTHNEIIVTVQDNSYNRDILKINNRFFSSTKKWRIIDRDFTKSGLIILTCEFYT